MSSNERLRIDEGDTRQITRQRRGRPITCPNCATTFESMRRFQLECPSCGHAWIEHTNRNIIDWLREQPGNLIGGFIWVVPVICLVAFLAAVVYEFANDIHDFGDFLAIAPLTAVLILLAASIMLIGRARH
jgi:hypothetical protein